MNRTASSSKSLIYFGLAALLIVAVTAAALLFSRCNTSDKTQLPNSAFNAGTFTQPTVSAAKQKSSTDAVVASVVSKGNARVIIQVATNLSPNASAQDEARAIAGAQNDVVARTPGSVNVVAKPQLLPLMVLDVDATAIRSLAASSAVVSIMEDSNLDASLDQSIPLIGGPAAFNLGATGKGWSVAILDSGVEASHSFLGGRVIAEACFSTPATATETSNCPNGTDTQVGKGAGAPCPPSISSSCAHGTHVAGIAAGNGSGGSGVAKDAGIVSVQIFHQFSGTAICGAGHSSCVKSSWVDEIRGLEWVLENHDLYHIAAVNMSLGGAKYTDQQQCDADLGPVKAAFDKLVQAGVAVVVAAGNESYSDGIDAPGCLSSAIAVGSTTKTDGVSDFSNSSDMVDLWAPGTAIQSSVPGNAWGVMSGTSMSTPHVAGAFTLLRSIKPDATVAQILDALRKSGKNITDPRNGLTLPRIQLDKAVLALRGGGATTPTPRPTPPPRTNPAPNRGVPNDDVNNPTAITTPYFKDTLDARAATLFDDPVIQPTSDCEEGGQFDHTVWYSFTAPASGYVTLSTEGSSYDTIMTVFQGTRGNATQIACEDDDSWPKLLTSTMSGWVRAGTTFRIEVAAWDDGGDLVFQAWFKQDNAAAQFTNDKLSPFSFDENLTQAPSDLAVSRGGRISRQTAPCRYKEHRPNLQVGTCFGQ